MRHMACTCASHCACTNPTQRLLGRPSSDRPCQAVAAGNHKHQIICVQVHHVELAVDRGVPWENALAFKWVAAQRRGLWLVLWGQLIDTRACLNKLALRASRACKTCIACVAGLVHDMHINPTSHACSRAAAAQTILPSNMLHPVSHIYLSPSRTEVEDKLEEMEPGRNHLSGFYIRRGHEVTAGGRRLSHIFLVSRSGGRVCGLSLFWSADLAGGAGQSVDWRERLLPCQAGSACPVLLAAASPPSNQVSLAPPRSRIFPQATEIIKSASNIRNTRFHIQRPNMGSVESKRLQVGHSCGVQE